MPNAPKRLPITIKIIAQKLFADSEIQDSVKPLATANIIVTPMISNITIRQNFAWSDIVDMIFLLKSIELKLEYTPAPAGV